MRIEQETGKPVITEKNAASLNDLVTGMIEELSEKEKSVYEVLSVVDCADKIEKKNGLSYLSWSYAWGELLKRYPYATYKVYENNEGWNYFTDGKTCWVKTGVTVQGKENIEYLPVMDFRNKSIPAENVTSFDVNKAIQRSLTKAIARHGLGLYVYAGEDLPENLPKDNETEVTSAIAKVNGYISNGTLKDDFAKKAQVYIHERNLKGLQSVIKYCEENKNDK